MACSGGSCWRWAARQRWRCPRWVDKATYFYALSDLVTKGDSDASIRNSRRHGRSAARWLKLGATVRFTVTDNAKTWPVTYTGIVPDLFREGQGVIAEGRVDPVSRVFVADTILAKHDEKYMPPEVAGAMHKVGKVS